MSDACATAARGTKIIEEFLEYVPNTLNVENVEDDPIYREKDIDLLWTFKAKGIEVTKSVEIKVDTYHATGNYFFETISNVGKNTPGCFMYSEADLLFYYFLGIELHIIPLKKARAWFVENKKRFRRVRTSTIVGGGKYYTEGALVNRADFIEESGCNVKIIKL